MHSPAVALAWQTWGRHRWGLVGLVVGVAALCLIPRAYGPSFLLGDLQETHTPVIVLLVIGLPFAIGYVAYVFSYLELGARVQMSGFPRWMFTLPVPTWKMVAWPMVSAGLVVALIWVAL